MTNNKDIENYINMFLNPLFVSGQYQKSNNIPLNFDSGNFGEGLVCIAYDKKGSGSSGGYSFDTADGDEVKTLCFFQSKKCKNCEYKNGFFVEKCFQCNNPEFTFVDDTRSGINSIAHYKYFDKIGNYYIVEIKPNEMNFNCISATIKIFIIDKSNMFFNELLEVQMKNSKNPSKNFFTDNAEFWLCSPSLSFHAVTQYSVKEKVATTTIKFINDVYDIQYVDRNLPSDLFKKAKNKEYKKYVDQIDENGYDPISNPLNINAKKGTHGKDRGITKRNNLLKGA